MGLPEDDEVLAHGRFPESDASFAETIASMRRQLEALEDVVVLLAREIDRITYQDRLAG